MAPPMFIIHRVVLWIAQHIAESFSLDADFFLVAWDGVRGVKVFEKSEKNVADAVQRNSLFSLCHD